MSSSLGCHLSAIWLTRALLNSSWTFQNLLQVWVSLAGLFHQWGKTKNPKRTHVCCDTLVFGVSSLVSDLQEDVVLSLKGEPCHHQDAGTQGALGLYELWGELWLLGGSHSQILFSSRLNYLATLSKRCTFWGEKEDLWKKTQKSCGKILIHLGRWLQMDSFFFHSIFKQLI